MTLLVRDEADILETHLRYHLNNGIDAILITDNGSVDGTRELAADFVGQGVVDVIDEPEQNYAQSEWVTRMAHLAATRFDADGVVHADADEFFVAPSNSLKAAIEHNLRQSFAFRVERMDFVPFNRPEKRSPPEEMVYRKVESLTWKGTPLPPKLIHRSDPDIIVSQGNHNASSVHIKGALPICENILIYHYPIRSYRHFQQKAINGGSAYLANDSANPNMGQRWKTWYQMYLDGQLPDEYTNIQSYSAERLRKALDESELIEDRLLADLLQVQ
jgi:hypothetical protein